MAVGTLTYVKTDPAAGSFSAIYTADGTATASGVYIGFKPRVVRMTQVGGTAGTTVQSGYHEGMTAAYAWLRDSTGTFTIPTSNGYTLTDGSEATVVTKAVNSPNSSGPGFVIGTGVQGNSLVYMVEAFR